MDGHHVTDDLFDDPAPANASAADWTTERDVWTVTQVADRMGCPARTVRLWCEQGLLAAERTEGGHHRIPAANLRAYLNGHAAPLTAAA